MICQKLDGRQTSRLAALNFRQAAHTLSFRRSHRYTWSEYQSSAFPLLYSVIGSCKHQREPDSLALQVADILARGGICERASIDEAYIDVTEEAQKRLKLAGDGPLPEPLSFDRIHVSGACQVGECRLKHVLLAWFSRYDILAAAAAVVAAAGKVEAK